MKALLPLIAVLGTCCLASPKSHAAILVSVDPDPVRVFEGTAEANFDIVLASGDGDIFNGFTLAFGIGDGGSAAGADQDEDNLLITDIQIDPLLAGLGFTASPSVGGIGESSVLLEFGFDGGTPPDVPADGVLVTFAVDTSTAGAGDSFVLDPDLNGFSSAFVGDDGTVDLVVTNGTLAVVAIPEPSHTLGIVLALGTLTGRRRRCLAGR